MALVIVVTITTLGYSASQDFKGTVTGSGGTLTVDETANLSSKAPKASPSFTVGIGIGGVAAGTGGIAFPASA